MGSSWAPGLVMVLVQSVYALVNILYKLAANDGMSLSVLVAYRFLFSAAFITPIAFFAERRTRPKLTLKMVMFGFLSGLFGGSLGQNMYLKCLVLTSATFISALSNLIPAITFVVALSLRLERVEWNAAGKAKMLGTIMGMCGATILTFYKGHDLNIWNTNINLLETTTSHHRLMQSSHSFVLGLLLALAVCVSYSLWLIVQAKATKEFPCPFSMTAMMSLWASFQSVGFALCTERDWSQWVLGWNIRLLTTSFMGILGTGLTYTLVSWCVKMKGPLFVSIFQPLMLVMVALLGSLFLEEKQHLGTVFGSLLIVCGLYAVLWGNFKELKKSSQLMPENIANQAQVDMVPVPATERGSPSN